MSHSWLFYDVESSDLNTVFGQIMQYASIRVDENWQEIDRTMFYVALTRDRLLSPEAMMVHQIPHHQQVSAYTEYEAAQRIYNEVNTPNTFNGGYNTLGYDDEVLRFTFYRNFLDAYTHGYKNGCQRFDLFPMILCFYHAASTAIKWPTREDGKPSFKLEHLNAANTLATGQAHDALVDVSVCVALAKQLSQDVALWEQALSAIGRRFYSGDQLYTMLDPRFSIDKRFGSVVFKLGEHSVYKNTSYWIRLDVQLIESIDDLRKLMVKKRAGDTRLVIESSPELLNEDLVVKNRVWIEHNMQIVAEYEQSLTTALYSMVDDLDVDAGLYAHGPFSPNEQKAIVAFKENPKDWYQMIHAQTPRLQGMMRRFIWRHYPDYFDAKTEMQYFEETMGLNRYRRDYRNRLHPTPDAIIARAQALIEQGPSEDHLHRLNALIQYVQQHFQVVDDAFCA